MRATPRWSAYRILSDIEQGKATLDRRMDRFRRDGPFDRRDEAFVAALVYGVLRWRRRLDGVIEAVSTTPLNRIDRGVLTVLRLGVYQILDMDRVPPSAAVHTSVELVKAMQKKWLAGFVNAVLRNTLRRLPEFAAVSSGRHSALDLALTHSLPDWMVERWVDQFGLGEAAHLCRACNRIPPITLRTNTLKTDRPALMKALAGLAEVLRACSYTPEGIALEGLKGPLFTCRPFGEGWFQVQDEAAQAVGHLLAPDPGQIVLDACAGLGGKTAHLAALMQHTGLLVAVDRDRSKIRSLQQEMRRLGIAIVQPLVVDVRKDSLPGKLPRAFDRILLDAPCSGMGVVRRNPDIKWMRTPEDLQRCHRRQRQLLEVLAARLKPDGFLVYAVCSTEPEETHEVVNSFLKDHPDFAIDDQLEGLPAMLQPLFDRRGHLMALPHRHGTDGFFAVRLRRAQSSPAP